MSVSLAQIQAKAGARAAQIKARVRQHARSDEAWLKQCLASARTEAQVKQVYRELMGRQRSRRL